MKTFISVSMLTVLAACSTLTPGPAEPDQPESPLRALCDAGQYHAAMRALPKVMDQWAEYTRRTGNTAEGAAGFEYATTLAEVAAKGDQHWGRILDDPEIPYEYKTSMIFEILELRLAKGGVWSPENRDLIIIPRSGSLGSWAEVNALLRKALSEPDGPANGSQCSETDRTSSAAGSRR